ncbi:membrane associated rhomboid family serine protease [Salinibacter ruber]|uniref:rhomboid family intramembrane serine protease n=1 Tax=Salinibacter ruber TaxID=146919 RepID=UPI0021670A52|nr:rhomboid family intramembrane serine protease [Salinibacter ruber]MCS3650489.1 membrane associated rhomboid family serine protease [Salinibacter ruber]MCS3653741.1 membrane associated rhomboid family serine protease [Salinibacter ruber]
MERLLQAPITLALLVSNLGVSLYAFTDPSLLRELSFRPHRIRTHREFYRFLTAGFVHASGTHLAFNMITFYFFGPLLEGILGIGAFLLLYFGSELAAHALTFAAHRDDPNYSAVGASGAISGVVFAFCVFFPLRNLYLFFALPIPAVLFAFGYVFGSIYAMGGSSRGGARGSVGDWIAHEAHVGGALAGVVLTILLEPRSVQVFLESFRQLLG